jgi:Domain of unknown function (DUF4188)
MTQIMAGRFMAQTDEPFVVFMIGMRINQWLAVSKWLPTASAMGPMLKTLYQNPEQGFLGAERFFYPSGIGLVQYWRSIADLTHFARTPSDPHLQAWQKFNRAIGSDGSVGIWHETYEIPAGNHESIYVNMPVFGLAAATSHVPMSSHSAKS